MALIPLPGSRRADALYSSDPCDFSDLIDLLASNPRQSNVVQNTHIQADWKETPVAHIITVNIPGLSKDDVKIQVEERKRVLEISGELSKQELHNDESYVYLERLQGSFSRRFRLPENAKIDEVNAKMESGVLTLTIPKTPGREPRIKTIPISG